MPVVVGDIPSLQSVVAAPPPGRVATDTIEAFLGGVQESATALALRGELPEYRLPENASTLMRVAHTLGLIGPDLPLSFVAGAVASRAGPLGIGFAAAGVPAGLREALIQAYTQGGVRTFDELENVARVGLTAAVREGVVGALGFKAESLTRGLFGRFSAPVRSGAGLVAGGATAISLSSVLSGRVPTAEDFETAAWVLALTVGGGRLGAAAVARARNRLRGVYAESGATPQEVVALAREEPKNADVRKALLEDAPEDFIPERLQAKAAAARVEATFDLQRLEDVRQAVMKYARGEDIDTLPLRYEYITDPGVATVVARVLGKAFAPDIEAARRGILSDPQAIKTAASITAGGDVPVTLAAAPEELLARAMLLKGASRRAADMARAQAAKDPADISPGEKLALLASLEQVRMFQTLVTGASAEAARLMRILRQLKYDPEFVAAAEAEVGRIQARLKQGGISYEELVKSVASLDDPGVVHLAAKLPTVTTLDKFLYVWRSAALSGILTYGANLIGNTLRFAAQAGVLRPTEAVVESVRRFARGEPITAAEFKSIAFQELYGLKYGLIDALYLARDRLLVADARILEARKSAENAARAAGLKPGTEEFRLAVEAALPKPIISGPGGVLASLPFRLLAATDALYTVTAERGVLHRRLVARAVEKGLTPGTVDFEEFVRRGLADPEKVLSVGEVAEIWDRGLEAAFAERPGRRTEQFISAVSGTPAEFVFLFVRTPVNLLSYATQLTGPFALLSKRWREDFAAGGERASQAVSRVIVGTGLMWLAFELQQRGILNGPGLPLFEKERGPVRRATGFIPNSLRIGDKYYDISRFEPISKVLLTAAGLAELSGELKANPRAQAFALGALLLGNATVSTTYMSGLANVMTALLDPGRYGGSLVESYASGLIPRFFGQIARLADPMDREVDGVVEAIFSQIPALRQMLRPKLDVFGDPVRSQYLLGFLPARVSPETDSEIKKEADRLMLTLTFPDRYLVVPGRLPTEQRRIDLTPEQVHAILARRGTLMKQMLAGFMRAPEWRELPDYQKAFIFKQTMSRANEIARLEVLPPDSQQRVQKMQEVVAEMLRQHAEAMGGGQ